MSKIYKYCKPMNYQNKAFCTKYYKIFVIGILIISVASCRQKENYEFKIINNTDYNIDIFEFNDDKFEISPKGETQSFSRTLVDNCICPTNPQTSLAVRKFSDSSGVYSHNRGVSIVTSGFLPNNIIEINLANDPDFPDYTFKLSINK